LDDEPQKLTEPDSALAFNAGRLRHSVARDLEVLLNSRRPPDWELAGQVRCTDSILNFGIMDLSSISIQDSRSLKQLQDHLRRVIERFEPRLGNVRIVLEIARDTGKSIRFRVDAILRLHPAKPPVSFDATLQLGTHACAVAQR
jgi:type VI secretion system protein ImpF